MSFGNTVSFLKTVSSVYKNTSDGGSYTIRKHMNTAAKKIDMETGDFKINENHVPQSKPVCEHLDIIFQHSETEQLHTGDLIKKISKIFHTLHWKFGYHSLPDTLKNRYAYTEIIGPDIAPVFSENIIAGLVLMAPETKYPYHKHPALEESYLCLHGTFAQNDSAVHPPGAIVYNAPGKAHKITTGEKSPVLLLYVWLGTKEDLLESDMYFD